jgi:hypothetical protein
LKTKTVLEFSKVKGTSYNQQKTTGKKKKEEVKNQQKEGSTNKR